MPDTWDPGSSFFKEARRVGASRDGILDSLPQRLGLFASSETTTFQGLACAASASRRSRQHRCAGEGRREGRARREGEGQEKGRRSRGPELTASLLSGLPHAGGWSILRGTCLPVLASRSPLAARILSARKHKSRIGSVQSPEPSAGRRSPRIRARINRAKASGILAEGCLATLQWCLAGARTPSATPTSSWARTFASQKSLPASRANPFEGDERPHA